MENTTLTTYFQDKAQLRHIPRCIKHNKLLIHYELPRDINIKLNTLKTHDSNTKKQKQNPSSFGGFK
jgi:hypothetical protein